MSTHFISYPVTSDMGLRESINAMLSHVAYNGRQFGYLPDAVQQSNCERLLEDYDTVLTPSSDTLELAPYIDDSALLADLTETLVSLCNEYPVYDEERHSEIEHERLIEHLKDIRNLDDPAAEEIARQLFESGAYIEQSEYGANVSEEDYRLAVEQARN